MVAFLESVQSRFSPGHAPSGWNSHHAGHWPKTMMTTACPPLLLVWSAKRRLVVTWVWLFGLSKTHTPESNDLARGVFS